MGVELKRLAEDGRGRLSALLRNSPLSLLPLEGVKDKRILPVRLLECICPPVAGHRHDQAEIVQAVVMHVLTRLDVFHMKCEKRSGRLR